MVINVNIKVGTSPAVNIKFDFYCGECQYKVPCHTYSVEGDQKFQQTMDVFLSFLLVFISQETFSNSLKKREMDTIKAGSEIFQPPLTSASNSSAGGESKSILPISGLFKSIHVQCGSCSILYTDFFFLDHFLLSVTFFNIKGRKWQFL